MSAQVITTRRIKNNCSVIALDKIFAAERLPFDSIQADSDIADIMIVLGANPSEDHVEVDVLNLFLAKLGYAVYCEMYPEENVMQAKLLGCGMLIRNSYLMLSTNTTYGGHYVALSGFSDYTVSMKSSAAISNMGVLIDMTLSDIDDCINYGHHDGIVLLGYVDVHYNTYSTTDGSAIKEKSFTIAKIKKIFNTPGIKEFGGVTMSQASMEKLIKVQQKKAREEIPYLDLILGTVNVSTINYSKTAVSKIVNQPTKSMSIPVAGLVPFNPFQPSKVAARQFTSCTMFAYDNKKNYTPEELERKVKIAAEIVNIRLQDLKQAENVQQFKVVKQAPPLPPRNRTSGTRVNSQNNQVNQVDTDNRVMYDTVITRKKTSSNVLKNLDKLSNF